jgi:tryptophan synthase alpha chain
MGNIDKANKINNINKITEIVKDKKALITFVMGGDPDIEMTEKLILAMEEAGVDMIQIGIPFSDPVAAEGSVLGEADKRALDGGCTTDKLFDMVKRVRAKTSIPLLFMTYANPVYSYGKDKFMQKCKECGIDGVIIPDVPFEENSEFEDECRNHEICLISAVAPTSEQRLKKITGEASGFLHCMPSPGVDDVRADIAELIKQIKKVSDMPCIVGSRIFTPEQAGSMAEISDGIIISSAIVRLVARFGRMSAEPVKEFIKEVKHIIR